MDIYRLLAVVCWFEIRFKSRVSATSLGSSNDCTAPWGSTSVPEQLNPKAVTEVWGMKIDWCVMSVHVTIYTCASMQSTILEGISTCLIVGACEHYMVRATDKLLDILTPRPQWGLLPTTLKFLYNEQGRVKACAKCAAAQGPPKVKGPPRIEKFQKIRGSEIKKNV